MPVRGCGAFLSFIQSNIAFVNSGPSTPPERPVNPSQLRLVPCVPRSGDSEQGTLGAD